MRTPIKRAPFERADKKSMNTVPDGSGGTIAGGAMKPLDLMEILGRGLDGGGAVPGAARIVTADRAGTGRNQKFALSDGSQIVFSSLDPAKITA